MQITVEFIPTALELMQSISQSMNCINSITTLSVDKTLDLINRSLCVVVLTNSLAVICPKVLTSRVALNSVRPPDITWKSSLMANLLSARTTMDTMRERVDDTLTGRCLRARVKLCCHSIRKFPSQTRLVFLSCRSRPLRPMSV